MDRGINGLTRETILERLVLGAAAILVALSLLGCNREGASTSPPGSGGPPAAPSQPALAAGAPTAAQGEALYKQYCAPCHGLEGRGNGPAAAGLPVKPADHTNGAVMNKISDAELFKAIKEGGQAAGKSPAMPPWGGSFKDEQIRALVLHVRSLAKSR